MNLFESLNRNDKFGIRCGRGYLQANFKVYQQSLAFPFGPMYLANNSEKLIGRSIVGSQQHTTNGGTDHQSLGTRSKLYSNHYGVQKTSCLLGTQVSSVF